MDYKDAAEIMEKELIDTQQKVKKNAARIAGLEAQLVAIAHIAHAGGLDNLTEAEALKQIRILSLPFWDRNGIK